MLLSDNFKTICSALKGPFPGFTCGTLTVVLLSCVLFVIQTYCNSTENIFSVGSSVLRNGHLHRVFVYPFYHKTFAQLLLNIVSLMFLSGSLEKGVGTVRFLLLFVLLSSTTGFLYSFLDFLQNDNMQGHTEGLVPVTLACVALTTMHTKMTKGFLCGVSFPTMALPWIFLIFTTVLIPHTVLPCNIIAILIGWMFGKGWFSLLDISEARASILEKMMPFRVLKSISGVTFVPASTEERRKTLLPQISPTPGSYPVQAYAPVSSVNTANTTAMMYEGWPRSTTAVSMLTPPLHGHSSVHSFGLTHGHSHSLQ